MPFIFFSPLLNLSSPRLIDHKKTFLSSIGAIDVISRERQEGGVLGGGREALPFRIKMRKGGTKILIEGGNRRNGRILGKFLSRGKSKISNQP